MLVSKIPPNCIQNNTQNQPKKTHPTKGLGGRQFSLVIQHPGPGYMYIYIYIYTYSHCASRHWGVHRVFLPPEEALPSSLCEPRGRFFPRMHILHGLIDSFFIMSVKWFWVSFLGVLGHPGPYFGNKFASDFGLQNQLHVRIDLDLLINFETIRDSFWEAVLPHLGQYVPPCCDLAEPALISYRKCYKNGGWGSQVGPQSKYKIGSNVWWKTKRKSSKKKIFWQGGPNEIISVLLLWLGCFFICLISILLFFICSLYLISFSLILLSFRVFVRLLVCFCVVVVVVVVVVVAVVVVVVVVDVTFFIKNRQNRVWGVQNSFCR